MLEQPAGCGRFDTPAHFHSACNRSIFSSTLHHEEPDITKLAANGAIARANMRAPRYLFPLLSAYPRSAEKTEAHM